MNLPKDPAMLLSCVNTQLRDNYPSLDELAEAYMVDKDELAAKLEQMDYHYDAKLNKFV